MTTFEEGRIPMNDRDFESLLPKITDADLAALIAKYEEEQAARQAAEREPAA
jgi:hypothetical protein